MTEEAINQFDKIIDKSKADFPDQKRKGKKSAYTSMNGHMFSYLEEKGSIAIRLSKEDRLKALDKYDLKLAEAHNTIMKEYVSFPLEMLLNTRLINAQFKKSLAYVASLKPKPTKRPK